MSIPMSHIKIESFKHDGSLHRRWEDNAVLYTDEHVVIGMNNHTLVTNSSGSQVRTTMPALFYFDQRDWFNIVYLMDVEHPYYYCNISSPFIFNGQTLTYIDYDVDVIVEKDFSYKVVDKDEFTANSEIYGYSETVHNEVASAVQQLEAIIIQRKPPFQTDFIHYWQTQIKNTNDG